MNALSRKFIHVFKKIGITVFVLMLVLAITGTVYQTAAAESDRRNFPAPGNLIDVGGFKMHIYCTGQGSPTLILETLSGGRSSYWGWVQAQLEEKTRVCSYDRAGRGWSEPDPETQTLERTVRNLHTLLENAHIDGPYVLVGHSIGGIYVRQFAAQYPGEVAGMVLVDASNPYQFDRYPEMMKQNESYMRIAKYFPTLAGLGLGHLYFALGQEMDFADMREPQKSEIKAVWSSPEQFKSQYEETAAGKTIFTDGQKLGSLGNMPLIVLTRGKNVEASWMELQNELATLSTNSLHITVGDATHVSFAFNQKDAQIVSNAIREVIHAVQSGGKLPREESSIE